MTKIYVPAEKSFTQREATPAMLGFMRTLAGEREFDDAARTRLLDKIRKHEEHDGFGFTMSHARDTIDWLKRQPKKAQPRQEGEAVTQDMPPRMDSFTDIPDGFYAVKSRTGNNDLDFFHVERPTKGKYEGYTFLNRVLGGHDSDLPVKGLQARYAMQAIREAGVDEAGMLFAQELNRCRDCGRTLTDEESRRVGKGPYCRSK